MDEGKTAEELLELARKDYQKHHDAERLAQVKLDREQALILKNDIPTPQEGDGGS